MSSTEVQIIYGQRFAANQAYRRRVWQVLIAEFFQPITGAKSAVLDLGCGYGEFINQIAAREKYGMDLNPDSSAHLAPGVHFFRQDCSQPWPLPENTLDVVFTSNFFEHLPDKAALGLTLDQIRRCLKPGGRLIALGPNIKYLPGAYWDFWDHYLPLTETSLCEGLANRGFSIERCIPKFLPYTMVKAREQPMFLLRLYLKLPLAWNFLGKQFLIVAAKT
ncbi:Methyltransferase type 11 [Verrucomicrobia bacterium]|nr:Methyltransferase type 11 [Verrucomicrobiota bacterium]